MPKLTRDFSIVLPGNVYPTLIEAGKNVEGDVAEKAAAAGCIAKHPTVNETRKARGMKAMKAPENK